jgi:hypothetical protein
MIDKPQKQSDVNKQLTNSIFFTEFYILTQEALPENIKKKVAIPYKR